VTVPRSAQGRSFGELHVHLPAGTELTGDDEAILTALADQAAVAQQNATLLERQRRPPNRCSGLSGALPAW